VTNLNTNLDLYLKLHAFVDDSFDWRSKANY